MEKSSDAAKIIGALIIGAAVGGALGLLFAPDKGSETRKKLMRSGEDTLKDLEERFNDYLAELKGEVESVQAKEKACEEKMS
jgi:gas vesicle protein